MKIAGGEDYGEYILGDFTTENPLESVKRKDIMNSISTSGIQLNSIPSPSKMDGIAEIENILRLISKSHSKDVKKKDGSDIATTIKVEQDPLKISSIPSENSLNTFSTYQHSVNSSASGTRLKPFETNNADVVELLRRMLDKTLQALKICHQKLAEANKRHEASQLEIQKLQDEIRNLRAQVNPPQLQLMKGISSLSSGNKRRRFRSPSSSCSSTRSSFSSHRRSSRRSESPPQLSPAFIPKPIGSSSSTQPNKRPRFGSPHSTGSYYSEDYGEPDFRNTQTFNRDDLDRTPDLDDTEFPDLRQCKSTYENNPTQKPLPSGSTPVKSKVLRSNMKNTSHLISAEPKHKYGKQRSSSAFSLTRYDASKLRSGGSNSSNSEVPSRNLLATTTPVRRAGGASNNLKKPVPPLRTYGSLRSSSAGRTQGARPRLPGRPPGRKTRSTADLEPPVLENNAETESDEEFDAFSAFKNDEDESSEELVDIDDDIPPRPLLPTPAATASVVTSGASPRKSQGASAGLEMPCASKVKAASSVEPMKTSQVRASSLSLPSSPLSSEGSNKSSKSSNKKSPKAVTPSVSRKFRSSTISSRAATQSATLNKTRLRRNRDSSTAALSADATESPFPPRQFDKKIDYSTYLNGMYPLTSENVEVVKEEGVKIKSDPHAPSSSKHAGVRRSSMREILDRFAMRMDETENCMLAKIPYSFYQSEIKPNPEIENEDLIKSGQPDLKLVEIPRWRETIFEPYDGPLSPRHFEEQLDDQVFLKRHSKCEINEKRRKRWDSQRMREESYLEKLKQKREERERQKKLKRRRGRNPQNDKAPKEEDVFTFHPNVKDAIYVRNDPEIPISVFGYPLPLIEPEEFELPWAVPTKPARSPRKTEVSKLQTSTNNSVRSGLKNALRHQAKR